MFWIPALFEREYGFSTTAAGGALAALALAAFVGTWYGSPFADRNTSRGFRYLGRVGVVATFLLTITWSLAFLVTDAALCLLLLSLGALIASLGTPGLISIVAAVSPPRIRSQAFSAFGLALAVFGAAAAPLIVGAISELLQTSAGMAEGEALRWAMLSATTAVMLLGTWLVHRASHYCAEDAQRTMAEFLADFQRRAAAAGQ